MQVPVSSYKLNINECTSAESEPSGLVHTPLNSTSAVLLGMALGKETLYRKFHDLESNQSQLCRLQAAKVLISNYCAHTLQIRPLFTAADVS